MKQDDKRCGKCVFSYIERVVRQGLCARRIQKSELTQNSGLLPWPTSEWCGEGRWRDKNGNLVGWTDQEAPQSALPPVPKSLFPQPHPIHWIRMEDGTPPAQKDGSGLYLTARKDELSSSDEIHYSTDFWLGDRFLMSGKGFTTITHWAYITPPEE